MLAVRQAWLAEGLSGPAAPRPALRDHPLVLHQVKSALGRVLVLLGRWFLPREVVPP